MSRSILRNAALLIRCVAAAMAVLLTAASTAAIAASPAPVGHVFVIVLENEDAGTSFGPKSPAPYLAHTLTAAGAYLPNYYGIGHSSLDNYIAMISGQPPDAATQADCRNYSNFDAGKGGGDAGVPAGDGCVYPAGIPTIAAQLDGAGRSWKAYMEDMGNTPSREPATCGHPKVGERDDAQRATAADQYATRHDPFVYFHGIIDNQAYCDAHVVNLVALKSDLQQLSTTPSFSYITPNLCNDGHDSHCANGDAGSLPQADKFLQQWVPQLMNSPAYKKDGLIVLLFDEADDDSTACCNEPSGPNTKQPGKIGPGGGRIGAVLLSPFIKGGTVTNVAYNHYSLLKSIEDIFGVGYLGYAAQPGLQGFGGDIFNNLSVAAPAK